MCRHLGYLGPPRAVGELIGAGSHSLRTQSWAPRDMRGGGTINADGFGAAWWGNGGAADRDAAGGGGAGLGVMDTVTAYRNPAPIWTDPAIEGVLGQVHASAILAAVRSATVGMPLERAACAPFTGDGWALSHNGRIEGWPGSVAALAEWLPAVELLRMPALTDSALLWTLVRRRLEQGAPEDALCSVVADVLEASPQSRLNLLLGNGSELWATTVYHSLSVKVDETSAMVASEPIDDDPGWRAVPDGHLVHARPGHLNITELGGHR
ncbi:ergothioneine biosynthesis protein EgtC [Rhodococcus sp. NPDC058514]|uniref:ergothioneine biosynthesis protein EgtC n=1 Tax=unclassified Rhodococcus (in: high G+C Gram-positive bacteria) TaxID=192944 RepID=UPI0036466AF9